ncbi:MULTISPECIES: tRNA lysidine(34) synthetase TilS [unclassified Nitratiruptor]|uniref:tRNA lysidine(34) synthetase TilS n=1 Tax=unclassified Nitratiruptor TaxID=2624044 RepID=UPI00191609AE|nr:MULTISPECIES: tRNA lysidine(34) synthetase TilS [unclassified Nitratiruptor]BCD60781.1 tRNA(Ile)-lysidine synthase [Nitratiruptor sp. YY08-10]BCD64713.1 tRNA(Ile)-lysidine synthase [Nitratiruptor sp. YY08-14]
MELSGLDLLKNKKNLLAFSAGVDSTALFFLLLEKNIDFDIAIVDYGLRSQSKDEVVYAVELAKKYKKKIFAKQVTIEPPSIEEKARNIRYRFFDEIIQKEGYHNLITAHQLNDQLEWFLMQLGKGAGLYELVGMDVTTSRKDYTIVRPLLFVEKSELQSYLEAKKIPYFIDESNLQDTFFRNYIRHNFSDPFMKHFGDGVKKSFRYLLEDKKILEEKIQIHNYKELYFAANSHNDYMNKRILDRLFKKLGYLLSSAQKEEILRQKEGVIASKYAFAITQEWIIVAPFVQRKMDKKSKEALRRARIPKPLRGYILSASIPADFFQTYTDQ